MTPKIIRTVEELEALDPGTLVMSRKGYLAHAEDNIRIPAVVVTTGEHVRAARQELKESSQSGLAHEGGRHTSANH